MQLDKDARVYGSIVSFNAAPLYYNANPVWTDLKSWE
jgi:hypothetical protein